RINGCEMSLRRSLQQFLFILHLPQRRQNCLRDNFLSGFFLGLVDERADAILLLNSSIFLSERTLVANLAAKNRLPAMYPQAEDGGFTTYGVSIPALYRRAATYVDKILKGSNPPSCQS